MFDKGKSYRRKSSIVSADAALFKLQSKPDKAECIVHQFLAAQQKSTGLIPDGIGCQNRGAGIHDSVEDGLKEPCESIQAIRKLSNASKTDRCSIMPPASSESDSEAGQFDEKDWARHITKSSSELDKATHEGLHTRLLTKKQLSEMAWGVRQLSRRLGGMRLKFKVKSIFLLTKIHDSDLIHKARELTRWLLDIKRDVRYTVFLERTLKENKHFDTAGLVADLVKQRVEAGEPNEEAEQEIMKQLRWWESDMCRKRPHTFDFVITLGGDGTVLFASWLFQRLVPPVLSFALGSLGFLTKFDFEDYQKTLTGAFSEGVTVSLRLRFEGTVMRSKKRRPANGDTEEEMEEAEKKRDLVEELIGDEKDDEHTHRPDGTFEILNEIVVDRGPNPSKFDSSCWFTRLAGSRAGTC